MTTESGESMLRLKALLLRCGVPENNWRNSRAENLARMIAWRRRPGASPEAERYFRRIILEDIVEDIVEDIGWPRWSWLFPRIRQEQARIAASMADWERMKKG